MKWFWDHMQSICLLLHFTCCFDLSFSLQQISQAASTMLELEWVNVYYRRFDSYGVFVPIMFQEQFVIITVLYAYTIPRVVYYRVMDDYATIDM